MSDRAEPAGCLFCGIVAGEVPATVIAESTLSLAFSDLAPAAPTHVLVVPRSHLSDASELGPDNGALLADMVGLAQRCAQAAGIAASGYRLVMNVGPDGGNTVPHLHLHLLGGRCLTWPPG